MGDKFIFNAQLESVDQLWFPQLGVSYPLLANWRLGLNYETRFGSAGLSLQHPRFFVALSSESFSLNESPAMGFAMGMNLPF